MGNKFKHIELFAGCGGMSLGLEAAGFDLFMANELSPMAGETFAFNLLGDNLLQKADDKVASEKVLWVKSAFDKENLNARLRENPFEFSKGKYSDITGKTQFEKKLIIGNIDHFLNFLGQNENVCQHFKNQNIDLLSGGPPCQGFSLAGKRIKDDYKNSLPLSFAKFAGLIQPKVVILENVKGITSPFETDDGIKHYAWLEVAKAFSLKGFVPVCMLLDSKYFGIPQNRPRFILYAFRKDVFDKLDFKLNDSDIQSSILKNSLVFYNKVNSNKKRLDLINLKDIKLYDIESMAGYFDGKLLPQIKTSEDQFLNAFEAIGDITFANKKYKLEKIKSEYPIQLSNIFKSNFLNSIDILQNHETRNHSYKVKARFRMYQALNSINGMRHDALQVISGNCKDEKILNKVFMALKEEYLLVASDETNTFERPSNLAYFKQYLKQIESKKHSQRAIKKDEPAPAQMTIPDDLCHYSSSELRTLTVREMARFQSFPDWYVFRSKVTTGGKQRSYECPQYTQVGNAVPPLLSYQIGITIKKLLETI